MIESEKEEGSLFFFVNDFQFLRYTLNRTYRIGEIKLDQRVQRQLRVVGMCLLILMVLLIFQKGFLQRSQNQENLKQEETAAWQEMQTETQTEKMVDEKKKKDTSLQVVIPGGNPNIKVQICGDNYTSAYHEKLTLVCSTDYTVSYGEVVEEHAASEPVWFTPDDPWLKQGVVTLTPKEAAGTFTLPDLKRAQAAPVYAGKFLIEKKDEGIVAINELALETYLCSVVPSEMPAKYPLEALKAQAICARTYALKQLQRSKTDVTGADLDDSVSYQVYNNISRNERTDQAVLETAGQVLMREEELVEALYYSTSCGIDLSRDLSNEAVFCSFITQSDDKAYEKEEPWYRWTTYYSLEELTRLAKEGWQSDFGSVAEMTILAREEKGVIQKIQMTGEGGSFEIEGEYSIRKFLQTTNAPVTLQDGSKAPDIGMLPSAFFYLNPEYEGETLTGYTLTGGGYGHGNGMSQNGARHMADTGKEYEEILNYYYGQ